MAAAGLGRAKTVSASPGGQPFGDAAIVFDIDGLLFRLVRDRGQAFLDLAVASAPTEFHQFDDVEIAMGWRSIAEVLAKREPEEVVAVLSWVSARFNELKNAFSAERVAPTKKRVEQAAQDRGKAFTDRLRGKR